MRIIGVLFLGVLVAAGAWTRRPVSEPVLPFYDSAELTPRWHTVEHRVAPFALTDQTGKTFDSTSVAGRVYVASFIYTRCSLVCPRLVGSLKTVEAAVQDPRLRILSFSVTPDHDPPEVLTAFARERQIDTGRWTLLTGPQSTIYGLARQSYFADDARLIEPGGAGDFLHTEKLVLVDGEGRLRGVYNGTQKFDIEHLIGDIKVLLSL